MQPYDSTQRRGRQMQALRFERLVEQLIRRERSDWRIETEKRLSPDLLVDIYAEDSIGDIHIVEIKFASPQTSRRVRDAASRLDEARQKINRPRNRVHSILAFGGALSHRYRASLEESGFTLWDASLLQSWASKYPDLAVEASDLLGTEGAYESAPQRTPDPTSIPCGKQHWPEYQRTVSEMLEYLFCPPLNPPFIENSTEGGFKRRDIIIPNYSDSGFWSYLARRYIGDHIVVDAKNYCSTIGKDQVLQISNYLTEGGPGLFGIIVTRRGLNTAGRYICREEWILHRRMVIVINDADVSQMLETKRIGGAAEELIRQKIEDFRLAV